MKYYELSITCYLKTNICLKDVGGIISRYINYSMEADVYLKKLHHENKIKNYCHDYLYPREQDRIYKSGRVYIFRIRTPIKIIADKMKNVMNNENDTFKTLGVQLKIKEFFNTEEFMTMTPVVLTINNRYWTKDNGMELIIEKMQNNLEKKYKMIFDEKLPEKINIFQLVEKTNNKDIVINYKNSKLIGNKFRLIFRNDEYSQKMAFIALSTGILEKASSCGCGFVNYYQRR